MRALVRYRPILALVLGAGFLSACSDGDSADDRRATLAHNRALWADRGPEAYRFNQTKQCFCDFDYNQPTRVDVRDGESVRAEKLSDGTLLPPHYGMTVEDIFERIEGSVELEYFEVTYDPEFGYPVSADLDDSDSVSDIGFSIDCSEFVPLEPVGSCPPPSPPLECHCPGDPPAVAWRYSAWDSNDVLIATGCAQLTTSPRQGSDPPVYDIEGTRCITALCATDAGGPQHGTGDVRGTIDVDGNLRLDCNAGLADFNLYLAADPEEIDSYISGEWFESRFQGTTNQGRFLLYRGALVPGVPER